MLLSLQIQNGRRVSVEYFRIIFLWGGTLNSVVGLATAILVDSQITNAFGCNPRVSRPAVSRGLSVIYIGGATPFVLTGSDALDEIVHRSTRTTCHEH